MAANNKKEEIKEEIIEDDKMNMTQRQLMSSYKKGELNLEESEDIDGLIKWAKNLPDDIPNTSQTSFFINKQ